MNKIKEESKKNNNRICSTCVGEYFLSSIIDKIGTNCVCDYCNDKKNTISLEELANKVSRAMDQHYEQTFEDYFGNIDGDYVDSVIETLAEVDQTIAVEVRKILKAKYWDRSLDDTVDQRPFDDNSYYREKSIDDSKYNSEWEHFERSLKTQNRFFGQIEILEKIFDQILTMNTIHQKSVIVLAGPETEMPILYRARVMQSDTMLEFALKNPEAELGPPPFEKSNSGRMNAKGISVFYGAKDPETAISEVRPPIGCRVLVGEFVLVKKIRLLDVESLQSIFVKGSFFDEEYAKQWEHAKFLGRLSHRVSMPVMPDDEPADYLGTQAISDYLSSNSNLDLDGIIYPSILGGEGKLNVVLFHKSALVQTREALPNTEVSLGVQDEEGYHEKYYVSVPNSNQKQVKEKIIFNSNNESSYRKATLSLNRDRMYVHRVNKIVVSTTPFLVERYTRSEAEEITF